MLRSAPAAHLSDGAGEAEGGATVSEPAAPHVPDPDLRRLALTGAWAGRCATGSRRRSMPRQTALPVANDRQCAARLIDAPRAVMVGPTREARVDNIHTSHATTGNGTGAANVDKAGYGRRSRLLLLIGSMITVSLGGSLLAGQEVL
jgi:hypothetical protein